MSTGKKDTTHGNIGDSNCSMGRIAWFDAHARKRVGTATAREIFDEHLLRPIQNDLIANTWLGERYNCEGQNYRTANYFEYPSVVVMLLREIRYGINIDLDSVDISPFLGDAPEFNFHIGNVNVDFNQVGCCVNSSKSKN